MYSDYYCTNEGLEVQRGQVTCSGLPGQRNYEGHVSSGRLGDAPAGPRVPVEAEGRTPGGLGPSLAEAELGVFQAGLPGGLQRGGEGREEMSFREPLGWPFVSLFIACDVSASDSSS